MGSTARLVLALTLASSQATRLMVVTGASRGVGAEIARSYAQKRGWVVAALARDNEALAALADESPDGSLIPLACDVSNSESVRAALDEAYARSSCDGVEVLVNNAATYRNQPFAAMPLAEIDALIDGNLKGSMYVTRACLPNMIGAGRGRIIFINSVAGLPTWTVPGEAVYAASKHGLSGFADALGHELKGSGVHVTSLHPGGIDTPLQEEAGTPAETRERFLRTADVVATVEHVVSCDPRVVVKRIECFGSDFWH